jgi:hypothetical protein
MKFTISSLFHPWRQVICNVFLLAILILMLNAFMHFIPKPDPPIDPKSMFLLVRVDSLSKLSNNPSSQRSNLINVLQQRIAIDGNGLATKDNIKMQIRLFYAAILAGLASLLFIPKHDREHSVEFVLLILISLMYLLEVHLDDLYKRQVAVYYMKIIAADSLINLPPSDTNWYCLKTGDQNSVFKMAETNRWSRKLLSACQPDMEQLMFYLVPWFGICGFVIRPRYLLKDTRRRLTSGSS